MRCKVAAKGPSIGRALEEVERGTSYNRCNEDECYMVLPSRVRYCGSEVCLKRARIDGEAPGLLDLDPLGKSL